MNARLLAVPLAGLMIVGMAQAQQSTPTPAPDVPVVTIPPAASVLPPPIVALPTAEPTPTPTPIVVAVPRVSPTPAASPRPGVVAKAPVPRPTPAPRVASTPAPTPSVTPPVVVVPTPAALPKVTPPVPATVADDAEWVLPAGIAVLALGALAGLLSVRRRRAAVPVAEMVADAPAPAAPVMLERRPVAAPPERAWLAFEIRPLRAGINLLTATLDVEIVVRNDGQAPADDIRVDIRLLSAQAGQEAELAALFGEPIARPVVPSFALAPGETRSVATLATLPRGAINVLRAGERPMFVPVVAVSLRYATAGLAGQTAEAFAIGVERAGAAKLAPVWLDGPAKMHEAIGARAHVGAVRV